MSDSKQRVQDEKSELDKKLAALQSFLTDDIHHFDIEAEHAELLAKQYYAMLHYSEILQNRIELL